MCDQYIFIIFRYPKLFYDGRKMNRALKNKCHFRSNLYSVVSQCTYTMVNTNFIMEPLFYSLQVSFLVRAVQWEINVPRRLGRWLK